MEPVTLIWEDRPEAMDLRTPQPEEALELPGAVEPPGDNARPDSVKYLYATGSTPLEGFTIKRGVGRGGFGEVYFATSDAGKEVALKLIRRNLDVELRGVTHCLNLKHPNLIGVYDIRTDSVGDQWVVMEYVSGESLEEAIDRHPTGMPVDEALRWMHGIGAGVAYLHDHGIVHRDLKPGNVFVDDDAGDTGVVKIGDYGLSKFISCSRRSGQTESVGTVHYMAPEIANGRYGREIDTYALGIILYEMLTGHVPFEGESVGEVLMKHLTAEPDLSMLEDPYREIVGLTLAKDPEVRIGSVGEMLALLPDGRSVGPRVKEKVESWTNAQASPDGIGSAHLFPDSSVRGVPAAAAKPHSRRSTSHKEPLYEWLSTSWSGTVDGWYDWRLNHVAKAFLLFCLVGVVVLSVGLWGPLAAGLGIVYLFYYVFWSAFVKPSESGRRKHRAAAGKRHSRSEALTTALADAPPASAKLPVHQQTRREQAVARRQLRMNWRDKVNKELAAKPLRQKLTELLTSMVLVGIVCLFLSLLAVLVIGLEQPAGTQVPLHLWLTVVSTAGCWAILATSKFCEGRFEDQIPARMTLLAAGAGVGLLAFVLTQALLIGVPRYNDFGVDAHDTVLSEFFQVDLSRNIAYQSADTASPDMMLSVAYFALMFLMLRWWRLAEYTRRTRLSLVSVGLCICVAWIAHLVCWYPQPAGVAVAGVVALATQLVSPWLPPSARKPSAEQALAV
ncbi:MAG: serine/threonine-protein kinase [Aeoliella sp.]